MLHTYKAVLRGNRLEWNVEAPEELEREQAVEVYVTILKETAASSKPVAQGERMTEALEKLASINALLGVSDPSAWQREERQDRWLPDRNA